VKYRNPRLNVEERVEDLLARMSLEEKLEQLSGVGFETKENTRLGIPVLKMADGPVGVRHGKATAFPAALGLAASWDLNLVDRVGVAIAKEAKSKDLNYVLGPCVNIHRHPLGGRNFESYGEDPFLASQMAVAFVKGMQSQKVLTAVKHFACNNQEWGRFRLNVVVDERALHEIYFPAFKSAVTEGGAWSVMTAYNKIDGIYCSENDYLLRAVLKGEWGFKGFVVSDWGGTHSTAKAAKMGLDLEMPYGKFFNKKLLEAIKVGEVSEAVIDDKIRRLLRVRFEAGLFDNISSDSSSVVEEEKHRLLALEAARESIVLLKNEGGLLPLFPKRIKTLAVLGPNALEAPTGGGGSSKVTPVAAVSPLDGLRKRIGRRVKIRYAPGINIKGDILPLEPEFMVPTGNSQGSRGLWGEYFDNPQLKGPAKFKKLDKRISFNWGYDLPDLQLSRPDKTPGFSIRWQGKLLPPKSGIYKLNVIHNGGLRLYINERLLIDNWKKKRAAFREIELPFEAGAAYDIRIEYYSTGGLSMVKFGWKLPGHDYLAQAVRLVGQSDAAIIFAGLHSRFETESRDRRSLTLENQDLLIEAVARANPNTVVVIFTGSPVTMDAWLEKVKAVVQAWYPGQEGGLAVADILLGNINPSGKLPVSFIRRVEDSPAFRGYKEKSLKSYYSEGIFVGYRYLDKERIEPLFPFGHGLSYTQFRYSALRITQIEGTGGDSSGFSYRVHVDVTNTGKREGAEVVQVYVKDKECTLERPEKELKGFAKVYLAPGEKQTVSIALQRDSFSFYDPEQHRWVVEPGEFTIMVGSSSRDIRLKSGLTIKSSDSGYR